MEEIYQGYIHLTAEQLKLLCFLAYTGKSTTKQVLDSYAKGENITQANMSKLVSDIKPYLMSNYFFYDDDHQLMPRHLGPLLVYLLCEHPDWLRNFERKYSNLQPAFLAQLILQLRLCIMGRYEPQALMMNDAAASRTLVALAHHRAFMPLLKKMTPSLMADFVKMVVEYQMEHDITDPDGLLVELVAYYSGLMLPLTYHETYTLAALFDYYQRGVYDANAAALDTCCAHILYGLRALYTSRYDVAFKQLSLALREMNREKDARKLGCFTDVLSCYVLVLSYHLHESDHHKKLESLLRKEVFFKSAKFFAPFSFATYLLDGLLPTDSLMKSARRDTTFQLPLYQHLYMLVTRFFGLTEEQLASLPASPRMHFLRHELSPWLKLSDDERRLLCEEYGGQPLSARIHFKQQWELVLEELTPKDAVDGAHDDNQRQTRIGYLINNDRVEIREQSRLKSGEWGAGKRISVDAFRRGSDIMDDADMKIAASIRNWYSYDFDVILVLPHLIDTDRAFTGGRGQYEPVSITREKPYLIIQRTKTAFAVKSNIGSANLDKAVVYRKESYNHYIVIDINAQQRLYYKRLLQVGAFPLEAEAQLRQFLPKVSDVVEVHSDLVEGGTTLQQRDGSPQLRLQVTPTNGARNYFTVFCMARPLPDGITLFDPGTGLNPCVAEEDGTRYQVTRDMRGERENLQLLRTFIDDNGLLDDNTIVDEPFADRHPVILSAEGLLQLMVFVQEQSEHYAIEWPEGGQLHLKNANPASWNIGLKSNNGWFEVEGDIPIDEDTVLTAAQLLQLVGQSTSKGFIKLGEGEFLALTNRLRKQLSRLESLTTSHRGHLQISELHATLLGSALDGDVTIRHDDSINQLQEKISRNMELTPAIPRTLKAQLRDYQLDGFTWLTRMTSWGAGVCLADDMGLGKTIQTITFLLSTQEGGPALVAAPASVVLNWRRELERFAPSLRVIVLNSASDRHQAIAEARQGDVVLTTYGLFVTESEHLIDKQWHTICLDEAHIIKNRETKTSQAVMQLKAANRIILTGTPVQNHLGELWNLCQFINPGLLGSYDNFSEKYIIPIEQQDNKERSKQLRRIIQPFILRRTKQEVIEELPEKTEITMPVELSVDEMATYEVIRRRAKMLLEEEAGSGSPSVNTLSEITHLRMAACSAQLVEKSWSGECSKISVLTQLVTEIVGGGNSVLVFSQFTSFLALVRKALDKLGIAYAYLDGSVPIKQREQLVLDFQAGRQQVFIISLKAGGLGLNLTGANYVIHLDPWWNPAIEQQATDRAYRIGQRQNVTVYHLIAQHTIEEKILRLHESKRNLADAMLEGTSQSHKLTSRDLLEMISV